MCEIQELSVDQLNFRDQESLFFCEVGESVIEGFGGIIKELFHEQDLSL